MKRLLLLLPALLSAYWVHSQLTVQGGFTAQQLAENLAGPGLTVTNATLVGANGSRGTFNSNSTNLGVSSGVILSTGRIVEAPGQAWNDASNDFGLPGNTDLTNVAGVQTYDAAVLQFDFQVETDNIQFNFVFASEEYPEFVGSSFNDVFAFYISGPGIVGQQNIALVPNTTTPVAINNINSGSYWQYYIDNANGTQVRYDAFTTRLTARKTGLTPCETYTLSLRIADAGDGVLDSGVFLEENSLVQGTVSAVTNTVSGDSIALEGCIRASFTFNLDTIYSTATSIPITVGGTATNGVDYAYIDSLIVIPAGQQSATIFVDAFADGLTEGQEYVTLTYYPEPCAPPQEVRLYINDNTPITFTSQGVNPTCSNSNNGQIQLALSGGTPPYTVVLNNVDTFTTSTITNLPAGTYGIQVIDNYGCGAQAQVLGGQYPGNPVFVPDGTNQAYTTTIPISGFPGGATLTNANMIQSICLDLEHSFLGQIEIRLYAPNGQYVVLKEHPGGAVTNLGEPVANGPVDTNNPDTLMGNCYSYCFTNNPTFGTMVSEANNYTYTYTDNRGQVLSDKYLPSGSYTPFQAFNGLIGTPMNGNWTIWVKDFNPQNNGWVCTWSISLTNDSNGDTVTLVAPAGATLSGATTNASCGGSNGALNLTVSGGTGPFTYLWSNGATTEDLTNLAAGTYTVTVTGAGSCTATSTFQISNTSAPGVTGVTAQVSCPAGTNGGVNISVTGTGPFTYLWSNGATSQDINNVAAGTYSVTVTGAGGCQQISAYTVGQIPGMTATTTVVDETCGQENGGVTISVSGGTAPYSYLWSNGATTQNLSLLASGSYTVTVTDGSLCTTTRTVTIINVVGNCFIPCDLALTGSQITSENCGNGLGGIDLSVNTSNMPATYQWSNGATTQDLQGLSAGWYFVTISDANQCTKRDSFQVTNNTGNLLISSIIPTSEFCANGQGAVNLTVNGGVQPYTYLWSNGATTANITNLHAGNFSVTVTDANGCSVSGNTTVINNSGSLVQTYGNAMGETCGNGQGSVDITVTSGTGFVTYQWSNGATTEDLFPVGAGSYTCTVTDINGCQLITPTYVVANNAGSLSIFDIDLYDETCGNQTGAINLDISGGILPYSYTWSNGATTQDLSGLSNGTYSATVTDFSGCSTTTGPLNINDLPGNLAVSVLNVQNEICGNGSGAINIQVTGAQAPATYLWSTGNTSQDLVNRPAGSYQVTVTDANGCSSIAGATIQNVAGALQILNAVLTPESCGNQAGAINLTVGGVSGTATFAWSNSATTEDLSSLAAGQYSVTVSDASGCTATNSYSILNQAGTMAINNAALTNASCGLANGNIDLSLSGGVAPLAYIWSNGITVQDLNNALPGSYTCTITDGGGCIVIAGPYTIANGSGSLSVSAVVTQPTCSNTNGIINLTTTGQAPYSYLWSDNATTEDRTGLAPGTYSVTISDGSGCQTTYSTTLTSNPGSLAASVATITDATCGGAQGAITLNVSGGTTYTYLWSNGATTAGLTGISAGTYSVTVTSAGCNVIVSNIQVANQAGTLNVVSVAKTDALCGGSTGSIDLTISGGTAPITYAWSNGATTQDIGGLAPGVYTCTITGAGGCTQTASAVIQNSPGTLALIGSSSQTATCGGANGGLTLTIGGGTMPISYQWSNGATTASITGVPAGTYTCLVTDASGCSLPFSGQVPDGGGNPSVVVLSITNSQCNGLNGAIDISANGGTGPYSYGWSNGASTQDIQNLASGNYTVTITDANMCTAVQTINVGQGSGTVVATLDQLTPSNCGNPTGAVFISVNGSFPFSYSWSNGATTEDINGLLPGSYTVTVTDASGCSTTASYQVPNNSNGFVLSGAVITQENCGNQAGGIDISVAGGAPGYTYLWSNGSVLQDLTGLSAGTYTVTITDAQGCDISGGPFVVNNITGTLSVSHTSSDELCGNAQGSIDLSVVGGTSPYTYLWSNGATTQDISGLVAGLYQVTVTDGASCSSVVSVTVGSSQGTIAISSVSVQNPTCAQNSGSIDITMSGGTSPYTFLWSNGSTNEDLSNLGAGTYSVTVTDAMGCVTTASYPLSSQSNISFINVFTGDETCGQADGYIQIEATGGDGQYTYTLNGGQPDPWGWFFGLSAGTYVVEVTDGQGCTHSQTFVINNLGNLSVSSVVITDASCATCNDGAIDITVTPAGNYNYYWSTGDMTQDVSGLAPGLYSVNIDDGNACFLYFEYWVGYDTGLLPEMDFQVNLWPNPNNGLFQLEYKLGETQEVELKVYNMMGQMVWKQDLGSTQSGTVQVDLKDVPDGNYLVRMQSDKRFATQRITVQR